MQEKSDKLILDALEKRASDIHVIPLKDKALIQFRLDDELVPVSTITKEFCTKLIQHYKFLGGMDIGEKRKPQDGRISISLDGRWINIRLSTLPTLFQESLVLRILPQSENVSSLSELLLFPHRSSQLLAFLQKSHGLLIITGPTGSGKTTTLYSLIHEVTKSKNRKIVTLEDPIEQQTEGVIQVQVNEKAGITYSTGLRAILRHDPDIIMFGEIRDQDTAIAALRASFTGHLVLTTLHTANAAGVVYRLRELGLSLQDIEQSVVGIVAQRLVTLACPFCVSSCNIHCLSTRRRRRLAVCEILHGDALKKVIEIGKWNRREPMYRKIQDEIRKGIALGYLSKEAYEND